jgi:hypothetical protein
MKFCPSCGKDWIKEAKFCTNCGFMRSGAKELNEIVSNPESKEEKTICKDNSSYNHEKEVKHKSNAVRINKASANKNTYKSSEIKEKNIKNSQSTSKRKKPIIIGALFLCLVGVSTLLLISNKEPELSAQEKEALETYNSIKEAEEYIKENGYEEEFAMQVESQEEITDSETASEETVTEENPNTSETETDNVENDSIIEGTWFYPEMNQVYEITFVDDFNGGFKIDSEGNTVNLPFQVTNFIDDNLEITTEDGEVWTLHRDGNELTIWKDNGVNMIFEK